MWRKVKQVKGGYTMAELVGLLNVWYQEQNYGCCYTTTDQVLGGNKGA